MVKYLGIYIYRYLASRYCSYSCTILRYYLPTYPSTSILLHSTLFYSILLPRP